jgi:hypothetical protein
VAVALVAFLIISISGPACDGTNQSGSGGSLVGDLVVTLSWSAAADLDLGATIPPGDKFVAANFEGEPEAAPNCVHSGDLDGPGPESFTCTAPLTGFYRVLVDNNAQTAVPYDLSVTVGGTAVAGYPVSPTIAAAPGGGAQTMDAHTFTL